LLVSFSISFISHFSLQTLQPNLVMSNNTKDHLISSPKPKPSTFSVGTSYSSSSSLQPWSPPSSQIEHLKNIPKNKNVVRPKRNPNKG